MLVRDIMTQQPVSIRPCDSLRHALELMDAHDFHHLPVLSEAGHLIGVVTARECRLALRLPEITHEGWRDHPAIDHLSVRTVMVSTLVAADPDMSVQEAARLMLANYVTGLPVLLGETLVGILTVSDILIAFIGGG